MMSVLTAWKMWMTLNRMEMMDQHSKRQMKMEVYTEIYLWITIWVKNSPALAVMRTLMQFGQDIQVRKLFGRYRMIFVWQWVKSNGTRRKSAIIKRTNTVPRAKHSWADVGSVRLIVLFDVLCHCSSAGTNYQFFASHDSSQGESERRCEWIR